MQFFGGDRIPRLLRLVGWEENQPIYHPTISKQIAKVQKKVEERNFEIRKSLLEYDEVMDYQRKIFYSRRRHILSGKGLKQIIQQMLDNAITKNCDTILKEDYPQKCIIEWAKVNFSVELKESDLSGLEPNEIADMIQGKGQNGSGK